jgi:hypothetical protein
MVQPECLSELTDAISLRPAHQLRSLETSPSQRFGLPGDLHRRYQDRSFGPCFGYTRRREKVRGGVIKEAPPSFWEGSAFQVR